MGKEKGPQLKVEGIERQMRRSYDRVAPIYYRGWPLGKLMSWKASWQTRLVHSRFACRLPRGGRVLDLGCGVGVWLKRFQVDGFHVAGIDQSPKMVAYTRRRIPQADVFCRNMVNPGFRSGSFDGIISLFAIIHVPQVKQLEVFRHMYRLLVPGGHFLINIGAGGGPPGYQARALRPPIPNK